MIRTYVLNALLLTGLCTHAQQPACSLWKKAVNAPIASPADVDKMNGYDVHYYKLDVDVERDTIYISGNAEIHAHALKDLPEFVFELHAQLDIDSVQVNQVRYPYTRNAGIVHINTTGILLSGQDFIARIWYHGNPPQGADAAIGNGFSNSPLQQVTWTLSQPYAAYEWWPCKQVLYDKADSSDVWITTDAQNKAGSNGRLVNTIPLAGNKVRYEWKSRYPIDYYLISVAVAKYHEYNLYAHPAGFADSILVQNYLYNDGIKPALDLTPPLIELFSSLYGLYPFAAEKYGHCQAPLGGGMEHQTMTTMGAFSFDIVAHELAHQWFGDYVTCGSWRDIWLNEGFASYSEYIAEEHAGSPQNWLASTVLGAKNAWGPVYVTDTQSVPVIFDGGNTYNKGAMLLHMLRYEINNDSLFFLGLRTYLEAHKFSTALGTDFQHVMEQVSGKDFDVFFEQWYRGRGFPVFSARWNQVGNKLVVRVEHHGTDAATPVFKTPIDLRLLFAASDTTVRVQIDSAANTFVIDVGSRTVSSLQLDARTWLLRNIDSIMHDPLFNGISHTNDQEVLLMYPNPATERVFFEHAKGSRIGIMDVNGNTCITQQIEAEQGSVDVSKLDAGLYFVRVEQEGMVKVMKLLLSRGF